MIYEFFIVHNICKNDLCAAFENKSVLQFCYWYLLQMQLQAQNIWTCLNKQCCLDVYTFYKFWNNKKIIIISKC